MASQEQFDRQDIRHFLAAYSKAHPDDVMTIEEPVSDDQDVTAFIWALNEQGRAPLLHFRNVDNIGVEVVSNMFGSRKRIARMFDTEEGRLHEAYQARSRAEVEPEEVSAGPVTEIVTDKDIDLDTLPKTKAHRERMLALPAVQKVMAVVAG